MTSWYLEIDEYFRIDINKCMDSKDINWGYWRTFLAVLDTGSLSAAARHLSLTQPTAGRHIDNLEQALAAPLFIRSQEGLIPTPLALSLKPKAQAMSMSAYALKRLALTEGKTLGGSVRITASEIIGVETLPSILHLFRNKHSDVDLELVLNNYQDDLLNQDADIAIRMVRPRQKRLLAKKVGTVSIGLFAHQKYLKDKVLPKHMADLANHHLIGIDRDIERWNNISIAGRAITANHLSFRCDSDIGQLAALRQGLGIGTCHKNIAKKQTDLVAILPDQISFDLEMWVVMHEDLKTNITARIIFDHLVKYLPRTIE